MFLKPDELSSLKPNPKLIQSKFKGSYKLVDITFKPIFKPEVMEHIRKHNANTKTVRLPDGKKMDSLAGVVTTLKDVSTFRLDREGVAMTKNLEEPRNSLLRTLTSQGKKSKKKQRKKARDTSKRASQKAIRYLSQFQRKPSRKKSRKK